MLPSLDKLALVAPAPTGARDDPGSVESTDPLFDAVFAIAGIRDRIFGDGSYLDPLFAGVDPYEVCQRARTWANLHPDNAARARSNPAAWMRLVNGVFGHEFLNPVIANGLFPELPANPGPYPDYWQRLFFRLCGIYMGYRSGVRLPDEHEEEMLYEPFAMAAVIRDGVSLGVVPSGVRSYALCLAAVRSDPEALDFVPFTMHTRELMDAAMRNGNDANFAMIGNAATAREMLLERPELLRFWMRNLLGERQREILEDLLTADGSAFQYLPYSAMLNLRWINLAIRSFPWAIEAMEQKKITIPEDLRARAAQLQRAFRMVNMTPEQRANRHYVLNVVRREGDQLAWASQELRSDLEVAEAAVTKDMSAMRFVVALLRSNPKFIAWFTSHVGLTGWTARQKLQRMKENVEAEQEAFNAQGANFDLYEVTRIQELIEDYQRRQKNHAFYQQHFPEWYYKEPPTSDEAGPSRSALERAIDGEDEDEDEDEDEEKSDNPKDTNDDETNRNYASPLHSSSDGHSENGQDTPVMDVDSDNQFY